MTRQDILNKANAIIEEQNYYDKCIKAKICPVCGKNLILDEDETYIYASFLSCSDNHELMLKKTSHA